jgi:DNA polymerase I-like protein with 3'-5' exonuclease and polymerase domains
MSKTLLLITEADRDYVTEIRSCFGGVVPLISAKPVELLVDLVGACREGNITKIVSTNTHILSKLLHLQGNPKAAPKLENYAGSVFEYKGIEFVFIHPLKQLFTIPYGKFIAARFISKLIAPHEWIDPTEFKWAVLKEANVLSFFDLFKSAVVIAVDIETFRRNLAIRCIGYTAVFVDKVTGAVTTQSVVLPMNSMWALHWMRKFNSLPVHKVTQNGKYDNAYLLRYNAPLSMWYGDTAHFMHSQYSELPKDLAFLNAFFLRKVVYWKDLAETSDLFEYYRYNALDTWATANVWILQLLNAPAYALRNYHLEFPLVYPCLLCECTGVLRDEQRLAESIVQVEDKILKYESGLRKITGVPKFNPGSWQQVLKLLNALGCKNWEGTDDKAIAKAKYLHPLNSRVLEYVTKYRENVKLLGTYLRSEKKDIDYRGTYLYSLNPHNTDTGRLASRESAFWVGANVQNIPAGVEVKRTIKAPDGFFIAESDLEQAESRDTAHITGDQAIIDAVSGTRDFHSVNASNMSGVPYDKIYSDQLKKAINKALRTMFKRVNHGANYNMSYSVLLDTMGYEAVWEAKRLLNLPFNNPEEVCEYLLVKFHLTYKRLKGLTKIRFDRVREYLCVPDVQHKLYAPGTYYAAVADEVRTTKRLTSRAYHHTETNLRLHSDIDKYINEGDWTRVCFGKPWEKKLDLNALVAHGPQSLNARTLNEAFMEVFYKVALPNARDFRLYAQIHDSIFFAYREGMNHLAAQVQKLMEIPVTVRDFCGVKRTFTVPAALKVGKNLYNHNGSEVVDDFGEVVIKRAKYWSETE